MQYVSAHALIAILGWMLATGSPVVASQALELVSTTDLREIEATTKRVPFTLKPKPLPKSHVKHARAKNRCGTHDFGPNVMRRILQMEQKKKKQSGRKAPTSIVIDTYFSLVTDLDGAGDVANSVFLDQVDILNQRFNSSGSIIRFRGILVQRLRLNNALSTYWVDYQTQFAKFRKGGLTALNVFVVPNTFDWFGEAHPWFYTGLAELDGVVVTSDLLPGQGQIPMDNGDVLVHEVGHWLGLIHVFQSLDSRPCSPQNPNDYIADTNQMADATEFDIGCAKGQDTCPGRPGLDPTDNFMDYGDGYDLVTLKPCHSRFTPLQVQRMESIWQYYRVNREICASDEFRLTFQIRFDYAPYSTKWNITFANGTLVHDSIPDTLGVGFGDDFMHETLTFDICLRRQNYVFHIYDRFGDGINPPGFYKLSVDGRQVVRGGQDFTYSKHIPFGPLNSTAVPPRKPPIRKPTLKPMSNKPTTRKPTRKPAT